MDCAPLAVNRARLSSIMFLGCVAVSIWGMNPLHGPGAKHHAQAMKLRAATVAAVCPSAGGSKLAEAKAPAGDIKVLGHGFGHGMGMSQYGAQGAAKLGCSYATILKTYYANTVLKKQGMTGNVELKLASAATTSSLLAEGGTVKWKGLNTSVTQPKGSTWTVSLRSDDGTAGAALLDSAGREKLFVHKGVPLTASHSGTVVVVKPSTSGSSTLRTRYDMARFVRTANSLTVTEVITGTGTRTAAQKYLAGLAEVPISWPSEALKAQVVAARTYLNSKYKASTGMYSLTTTTYDQVYAGYKTEATDAKNGKRWQKAVDATAGLIITDKTGKAIEAMYSSSMGGYTENRQFVYGSYGISYLKAVDDSRWDAASDNPYRSWSKGFTKAEFAKRFGFDTVTSWGIGKRGSLSRVNDGVKITGTVGGKKVTKEFTGSTAKYRLGLRSTGFTFA